MSSVYAAWSDGTAATEFAYWVPFSKSESKSAIGMWLQIAPIERVVGSIAPSSLAIHGGAAGNRAYVVKPIIARSDTMTTYRRNSARPTIQSTAASR
jgi:hypothetical protein